MEGLSPCLYLIWELKRGVFEGYSTRWVINNYIKMNSNLLSKALSEKIHSLDNPKLPTPIFDKLEMSTQVLVDVVMEGLQGAPIHSLLDDLEKEIHEVNLAQMETFIAQLPFKMMIPLLLLQFPAIMIMTMGAFFTYTWKF